MAAGDAPLEQALDERAVLVTGGRMDDDAGRLVDDQQPVVLVDERMGNRLGREHVDRCGRLDVGDRFAAAQSMSLAERRTSGRDAALIDEPLRGGSAEAEPPRKGHVEPLARLAVIDGEGAHRSDLRPVVRRAGTVAIVAARTSVARHVLVGVRLGEQRAAAP